MSHRRINLLLIEDNPTDADLLQEILFERNRHLFEVEWVDRLRDGLEVLDRGQVDLVLLDLALLDSQGLETFTQARARAPGVPIIVLSGLEDEKIAVQAVREGAQDYLVKGQVDDTLLVRAIRYAIERKRLEAERARLATVIEQMAQAVLITDLEGNIEYVNPFFEKITGYSSVEAVGQNPLVLGIERQDSDLYRELWETISTGHTWQGTFVGEREDSSLYYSEATIFPIKGPSGKIINYASAHRDITERVRVERESRQRTEDLALLNVLNDAVNRRDSLHEIIQLLSREIGRMLSGHDAAVYLLDEGKTCLVMQQPTIPPVMVSRIEEVLGGQIPEARVQLKAGSLLQKVLREGRPQIFQEPEAIQQMIREHTEDERLHQLVPGIYQVLDVYTVILVPLVSDEGWVGLLGVGRCEPFTESDVARLEVISGQLTAIIRRKQMEVELRQHRDHLEELVIARTTELQTTNESLRYEIAERKRAEQALREAELRYRTVADFTYAWEYWENPDGTLRYVSPSCERITGYPPQQFIDNPCFLNELIVPEDREIWTEHRHITENPEPQNVQFRICRRGGEMRWIEHLCQPVIGERGEFLGYRASNRDVTERVRLEERLLAIYQLGRELTLLHDDDVIAQRTLETAAEVLRFNYLDYALVNEEAGELVYWQRITNGTLETIGVRLPLDGKQGVGVVVVRDGHPLNVPDTTLDIRYISILGDQPIHSNLCVPMKVNERVIGVLNAESTEPDHFAPADQQLLQTLADQTAVALENARLYRASQERAARLSMLNAISAAAVSSLEMDVVLHQILEMTCQALDATEGAILLSDPSTEELVFALTMADSMNSLHGQRISLGQGIAGWVAQHGQAMCVNDVRSDPRWYGGVDAITGFETRSLLCAPLGHQGKIAGVIEVVNKKMKGKEGVFTDEDLGLLEAVSSIAAVALSNARLYTATRSYADRLVLLNKIGLALTSTLDFSTVVHAALSHVQDLFAAKSASLLRTDPQTGELRFVQTLVGTTPVEIPVGLQPGESIAGWALEHGQPVLVEDAQTDPRWSPLVDYPLSSQMHALMAVPLTTPERTVGIIEVASSEHGVYGSVELNILQAIASTLAVALENAGLYDELKALLREREEAQVQLIHSEKMAALGRLVASIAHEVNNPLQAVQSCLTLTGEELLGRRRPEKLNQYLGIAESEIERISVIVRRMRDFYRPARTGWQPTDVHAVLESVLALSGKQLQHSNVIVERCFQQGAVGLPEIQANPDHLKQVFLNLVLNAIDAMPEGGTLRISTAFDQMQFPIASGGGAAVRIEFSDTGVGIPPERQARTFEPFFTTKEQGSGLGLSISYGIVESHNGEITVTSQVGVGTTFTILLPVEQARYLKREK
ncbi:MAG: GAF domain-containing protein [Chloroflexota bacterium]|nr:GAF domain-containing protein [Chloroflexota bacterium]